jgi:hypothetical protein
MRGTGVASGLRTPVARKLTYRKHIWQTKPAIWQCRIRRSQGCSANGEIMHMNSLRVTDPATSAPKYILASADDIVSVLAHLAGPYNIHSSRQRLDHGLAQAALASLPQNLSSTVQPPLSDVAPGAVRKPPPQRIAVSNATRTSGRSIPVEATYGSSRPQLRQRCSCGHCKCCLGNARWDRIFKEKFDSPSYYGGLVVRHNSTLAEAL